MDDIHQASSTIYFAKLLTIRWKGISMDKIEKYKFFASKDLIKN